MKNFFKAFYKAALVFILFSVAAVNAISLEKNYWGEVFKADIYLDGTARQLLIFKQENSIEEIGEYTFLQHKYTYPDGKTATIEEVTLKNGEILNYFVDFANSDCGCKLERTGSSVRFSFTRGDTDRTGVRDYVPTLITGPTLYRFVIENWETIENGKKAYFHFPAMNLQRIVRFQISRNDRSEHAGEGRIVLKMDLANFLLRLFIEPVDLVFDTESKRLLEIHGKSLLEREVDGKVENPVVNIYYRYEE